MTTSIPLFYSGRSIFVTGATGFIGKVLVEKLLFECPDIHKIYILMRSKRGQMPCQRLEDFIDCEYFRTCARVSADVLRAKLEAVDGDITKQKLGLSDDDRVKLVTNVSVVFHSAASVKFDDPLKECLNFNVLGTKSVMDLCKKLTHLKAFVHVSTAYAYCQQDETKEQVYDMRVSPDQMLQLAEWTDGDPLNAVKDTVFEGRPNTYTFTKALAEQYIEKNRGDIPVAIARPSIVTATWKGPSAGWIDSYNGPGGMVLLGALGIARTLRFKPGCTADLVPVDVVVNALISIAWHTAMTPVSDRLPVYNITTGSTNPITWYDYLLYSRNQAMRAPSMRMVRPPANVMGGEGASLVRHSLTKWISEVLFAYVMDFILILMGRKAMMVNIVQRMHHALSLLNYFCTRTWSFPCSNLSSLIQHMNQVSPADLDRFYMDVTGIRWEEYIALCYMGARRNLLKESDSTISDARQRLKRIKFVYYFVTFGMWIMLIPAIYFFPLRFMSRLVASAVTFPLQTVCSHVV